MIKSILTTLAPLTQVSLLPLKERLAFMLTGLSLGAGCLVIHELGHAIPAKILLNQPIQIQLGGFSEETKPGITVNGFWPVAYTVLNEDEINKHHPLKRIFEYAAGPLSEFGAGFLAYKLLEKSPVYIKAASLLPMLNAVSNIIPWKFDTLKSDGWQICSELKGWYQQSRKSNRPNFHNRRA
jgi:hypothetical protein